MDGLLVGRNDFRAPDEVLTRFDFPPASQDLIRLPEFGAGGADSLGFPRLTAAEADHRIQLANSGEPRLWPLTPHAQQAL